MDDDQCPVDAMQLERDLTEVLLERALLWSVVALVRRLGGRPCRAEVDAVLAGAHGGRPGVPAQRRGPDDAHGRRRARADDFPRWP